MPREGEAVRTLISSGYPSEEEYGYSRAVRAGNLIFVSGTTARGPDLEKDTYEQAKVALSIIADALAEAGAGLDDVVRTTAYVRSLSDANLIARAHREAFATARPASTLVEISRLSPEAALVEIEVTAVRPESQS